MINYGGIQYGDDYNNYDNNINLSDNSIVYNFYNRSVELGTGLIATGDPYFSIDLDDSTYFSINAAAGIVGSHALVISGTPNAGAGYTDTLTVEGSVQVWGNFKVGSSYTKSKIVETEQYSERLLYCYETPSPMFADIGEGVIGEDGLCYITIDTIFSETISTTQYQVFLQKYGNGDCWVKERNVRYFIVEGTSGLEFGWEIKAKQKGFEEMRLDVNGIQAHILSEDYADMAEKHIKEIQKEREKA